MPRLARIVAVGHPHHVTHRGNRHEDVFLSDAHRCQYLAFLKQYADAAQLEIWAYCLMSNHVHLIAVPRREGALAGGAGLAHRRYAVWLNREEGLSGHLWANRFYSAPLDDAHHWAAVRYVEANPVRAGMVGSAAEYAWSSARAHILGAPDALLSPERPYPGPVEDWAAWLAVAGDCDEIERVRAATRTGRPCGGSGFVAMLERALGRPLRRCKPGPRPKSDQTEEKRQLDMLGEAKI